MPKTYAVGDPVPAADLNGIVAVAGSYATDAGGDDTYAITVTPVPTTYADGDEYTFKSPTGNTGACTLAVNGMAAKAIKKFVLSGKTDVVTGDIIAGQPVRVKYDGTDFVLLSPSSLSNNQPFNSPSASGKSIGTEYQNTSGKTLVAAITVSCGSGSGGGGKVGGVTARIGASSPAATVVAQVQCGQSAGGFANTDIYSLTIIIPDQYYYKLTDDSSGGSASLVCWEEYTTA